jgi:undecaprenyl diphosphate synthase
MSGAILPVEIAERREPAQPFHVAIIMDGNGRWAKARGKPRISGHRAGVGALRRTLEAAPDLGITTLTLYAFSSDNWQRPVREVSSLMKLLETYLKRESARLAERGARLSVIGRRDRLPPRVLAAIEWAERVTARARPFHLRIAVDYSARHAIATAASQAGAGPADTERFRLLLERAIHSDPPAPDVDLLVRTSGEQRLSDFLLWECAYAELVFTERLWPDFGREDLEAAVAEFKRRDRRYGRVAEGASG